MKKEWAVYDSSYHEMKFCESIEEANKHFESVKEAIFEEPVEGYEQVFLLEVVKVSHLVKDEERKDDPEKHGFDFWVKWQDEIINDQQQEIERLNRHLEALSSETGLDESILKKQLDEKDREIAKLRKMISNRTIADAFAEEDDDEEVL